jgi:TetR/AcrR family transcriptional regulator
MAAVPHTAGARSILEAATALFADYGFDGVSIATIARKAGVCKANVFHHFPSKDDLYLLVAKQASSELTGYLERLLAEPGSSAAKVRSLVGYVINTTLDNPQRTRLLLRELSDPKHARVRKLARAEFQRNFTAMCGIFLQGRERGEFAADVEPGAAAMLVSGAAQSFFVGREAMRDFHEAAELDDPALYAERVSKMIVDAVTVRP